MNGAALGPKTMKLIDLVKEVLPIFVTHKGGGDDKIIDELKQQGVASDLAIALIEFVPLAFTRNILEGEGPVFANCYARVSETGGRTEEKPLAASPVYRAALACARQTPGGDAYLAVAGRSAEFKAVNELVCGGSMLEDLRLTPPLFMHPHEADCSAYEERAEGSRKWWRFWK